MFLFVCVESSLQYWHSAGGSRTSATEKSSMNLSNEGLREKNLPSYQASANTFRPFVKNPAKQERYDKYLELAVRSLHKAFQLDKSGNDITGKKQSDTAVLV